MQTTFGRLLFLAVWFWIDCPHGPTPWQFTMFCRYASASCDRTKASKTHENVCLTLKLYRISLNWKVDGSSVHVAVRIDELCTSESRTAAAGISCRGHNGRDRCPAVLVGVASWMFSHLTYPLHICPYLSTSGNTSMSAAIDW